jgi:thioesterase domain-containing protein
VALLVMMDTYLLGRLPGEPEPPRGVVAAADFHLGNLVQLREHGARGAYVAQRARAKLGALADRARARLGGAPTARSAREVMTVAAEDAVRRYVPAPYPGRVTMLLSRDEPDRTGEDRRLRWADLAEGGLVLRFIPGAHETMLDERNVAGVAAVLDACLRG